MEQQRGLSEFEMFIQQLREEGRALQGDGFGYIGNLKAAYKKACKALDELNDMIKNRPVEEPCGCPPQLPCEVCAAPQQQNQNPDCLGQGADNLPHCRCRIVFLNSR